MEGDPLVFMPMERWTDIQETFKTDWPRGIAGFSVFETQRIWENQGWGYGFKVYCPFGDLWNGIVALNIKGNSYELIIQCPKDDTSKLEEALQKTKLIDWSKSWIIIPVSPPHIISALERLAKHLDKAFKSVYTDAFYLETGSPLFEVSLPPEITFKPLSLEHAELVNSKWPHRFPGSVEYFHLLIKAKSAYGLFEKDKLAAWMLISEAGYFNNLYTLEEHRRKGYAELVVKLISNMLKNDKLPVFGFVVKGNVNSFRLFEKQNFSKAGDVAWCFFSAKEQNSSKI